MTLDESKVEEYNDFVASSPQGTLFCTTWWLDAVAPGQYEVLSVKKGGTIHAAWPIVLFRRSVRGGFIGMPPLTPWLGILYRPPASPKLTTRLSNEKELAVALIEKVPAFGSLAVNFHRSFDYWLPLYWQSFEQMTRYTYVLLDLSDLDVIWDGMRSNIRREIRKARKEDVGVTDITDIDSFLEIHKMTFERRGMKLPYDEEIVHRIDIACRAHNCRKMLAARGSEGDIHAVAYIVWDDKSAYYLMGGGDPDKRTSGATSLLMWEAIQFAATVTQAFDFEGSMIESVERFFRAFGATPCPYYAISKVNSPLEIAYRGVRNLAQAIRDKMKA
jgi:hypothetical protein